MASVKSQVIENGKLTSFKHGKTGERKKDVKMKV